MDDLVTRFAALFEGRDDAFGTDEGGCIRFDPQLHDPLGPYYDHLKGVAACGVYPLTPSVTAPDGSGTSHLEWRVKWGCLDLDVHSASHPRFDYETSDEALVAARNYVAACDALGWTAWIERTRSGGYHCWSFADQWVSAAVMRRAQLVACSVAGVPTTEVNPKQIELQLDQVGSYVRLPYPGALPDGGYVQPIPSRYVLTPAGGEWGLGGFLAAAERNLVSDDVLAEAAKLAPQLEAPKTVHITDIPVADTSLERRLNGLAWTLYRDGPLGGDDVDRSLFLVRLAHLCRESGLTASEAVAIVAEADARHTQKFTERRDAMERYENSIVRSAYA